MVDDDEEEEEEEEDDDVIIMEQGGGGGSGSSGKGKGTTTTTSSSSSSSRPPSNTHTHIQTNKHKMDFPPSSTRHDKFVKKLAKASIEDNGNDEETENGEPQRGTMQGLLSPDISTTNNKGSKSKQSTRGKTSKASSSSSATSNTKYTPLEQQVLQLKRAHPDTLLLIECGYRFRFFGEDALTASKILGIYTYISHNFYVASIPTIRVKVHLRRK